MFGRGRRRELVGDWFVARVGALLVLTTTLGVIGEARADEVVPEPRASCDAAFESAELRLRPSDGRLLEGRAALLACARPECKSWMVDDCSKRLVEVEARIPSVVFSAEDARGSSLYDVRVLEGDRELLSRVDGRAVEIDPGPHELVAERGGARVALSVVVIEGRKAQQVVFAFPDVSGADPATPAVGVSSSEPRQEPPRLAHPWARPLAGGLLVGAVVTSGMGVGLGIVAIGKKNDANCDAENVCDGVPLDSARAAARAATISFVASGVLAIGSAVTFLVFGRTRVQASAWLNRVQVTAIW